MLKTSRVILVSCVRVSCFGGVSASGVRRGVIMAHVNGVVVKLMSKHLMKYEYAHNLVWEYIQEATPAEMKVLYVSVRRVTRFAVPLHSIQPPDFIFYFFLLPVAVRFFFLFRRYPELVATINRINRVWAKGVELCDSVAVGAKVDRWPFFVPCFIFGEKEKPLAA